MLFRWAAAVVGLCSIAGLAVAQPDNGPPRWMANMARHQQVIIHGLPSAYSKMRDTTRDSATKLRRGAALFQRDCAACHGATGESAGPDAFALVPAPADLAWLARAPKNSAEPYIYWSIVEGGKAFGSEMPAYKDSLSRKDVRALAAYIRAGFPDIR